MHGDAPPPGHDADNRIAGDRLAALGVADHQVVHALNPDAASRAPRDRAERLEGSLLDPLHGSDSAGEPAREDMRHRDGARSDRRVEPGEVFVAHRPREILDGDRGRRSQAAAA